MAKDTLHEFFREKRAKSDTGSIDWQAKKIAWIKAIEELYKNITEQYLAAAIADGTVAASFEEKRITEDYIGEYSVKVLVLTVGDERVMFSPKGTNIIGASGRVDLVGDLGEVTVVWQPGDRWAVVATRTPTLKVTPLDEQSLLTALKSVMRK